MTELERLEAILRDELMDDYDFPQLAEALSERGVRVLTEEEEPDRTLFSQYARKTILEALVDRCASLCSDGTVEEILKFAPYVLNVTRGADFEIVNPGFAASPWVELGVAAAEAIRQQVHSDLLPRVHPDEV